MANPQNVLNLAKQRFSSKLSVLSLKEGRSGKNFAQYLPFNCNCDFWDAGKCHYEFETTSEGVYVALHIEKDLSDLESVKQRLDVLSAGFNDAEVSFIKGKIDCRGAILYRSAVHSKQGSMSDSDYADVLVKDLEDFVNKYNDKIQPCVEDVSLIKECKDLLLNNHNIILHGAPGTGKTFMAKEIASWIVFEKAYKDLSKDEKVELKKQMGFVQFHQSYDYTDFVEGLRPAKGNNDKADGFECLPGVFKSFCNKALKNFADSWNRLINSIDTEVKKKSKLKIGTRDYDLSSERTPRYVAIDKPSQYQHTYTKQNIYDTYMGREARSGGGGKSEMREILEFMISKCGLKKIENIKHVFIIDEINRGEISKIFGELFFSVDPGYRGVSGKVRTQYANMQSRPNDFDDFLGEKENFGHFFVPENVYIIGTMNDIDRSVESMDFAMRRRFAFKEVTAKDSMAMLDSEDAWKGDDGSGVKPSNSVLGALKAKMTALNEEIAKPEYNLGDAYQIGAAYFLKFGLYFKQSTKVGDDAKAEEAFKNLRKYHLEGLLREYLRGMDPKGDLLKKLLGAYDENPDQDNANVVQ